MELRIEVHVVLFNLLIWRSIWRQLFPLSPADFQIFSEQIHKNPSKMSFLTKS